MLSFQERQDLCLSENDVNMELAGGDDAWEDDNDADAMLAMPPPGEEGFFISNAGGESTLQQIFVDSMSKRYTFLSLFTLQNLTDICSANVTISEHDRIVLSVVWINGEYSYRISLMLFFHSGLMVHMFLNMKMLDDGTLRSSILKVRIRFDLLDLPTYLLGTLARGLHPFTHTQSTRFASVTLILSGYIGASPDQPTLAFSIQLLAFYRQLRCVHPRFSFDAFAKCLNHFHSVSKYYCRCHIVGTISHMYQVPHSPYLADQLSNAYDCYLAIIRETD